ncbi:phosphonate metabolism transcriptional regulator PhnF [Cytobacillus sp. FJAT-54145]|uniref:Phosphonate metabolism transcriptional regulator PhnF n=1 Tax=Cytobacillus spartinae TaxID=3299023 RepID=A0ABW6KBJ8_9BACI
MIDKYSPIPIYHQLEEYIRGQIENGTYPFDTTIPSERELAERFEISRMTVRQAINNLVNDGYLYREKGRGTFVNRRKVEQKLQAVTSFTEDMIERGLTPKNKLLTFHIIPANGKVASILNLQEHTPVYEIKRIRIADDSPIAIETTYLPANLIKGLSEEILNRSLYNYIENDLSLKISEATQEIEAASAKQQDTAHLQIEKGAPVLVISQTSILDDGTPFEYVKSIYRADRYKFVHKMKR